MFLNLYLEKRLADQRMHDDRCVAKRDRLLRGRFEESKQHGWSFLLALVLLPVMMFSLPFQLAILLLKGRMA
jgi:hypothetical protein